MPQYGDLVILLSPRGKRRILRLEEGGDWHTQDGIIRMSSLVEAPFGSEVQSSLGVPFRMMRPQLHDLIMGIKRQTQIMYPKDMGLICLKLGVGAGRTILEAPVALPSPSPGSPARQVMSTPSRHGKNSINLPAAILPGPVWEVMFLCTCGTSPKASALTIRPF